MASSRIKSPRNPSAIIGQTLPNSGKRSRLRWFMVKAQKGKETMKMLTTWNPFRELDEVQNRLSSFFGGFPPRLATNGDAFKLSTWAPAVDITEDDKEYLVKADLPEVKKEDVKVTLENGVLSIMGERKSEKEEKNKKFHRIERSFGRFERTFMMPEDAEASKMKAEFKDGVLRVHMPKNPAAQPKKIDVKVE